MAIFFVGFGQAGAPCRQPSVRACGLYVCLVGNSDWRDGRAFAHDV